MKPCFTDIKSLVQARKVYESAPLNRDRKEKEHTNKERRENTDRIDLIFISIDTQTINLSLGNQLGFLTLLFIPVTLFCILSSSQLIKDCPALSSVSQKEDSFHLPEHLVSSIDLRHMTSQQYVSLHTRNQLQTSSLILTSTKLLLSLEFLISHWDMQHIKRLVNACVTLHNMIAQLDAWDDIKDEFGAEELQGIVQAKCIELNYANGSLPFPL
ncbi:uncharacterized protein VP01_1557g4 [Puccinia sorghi]|uniref:DDE Tnp4 domain-containing protein n=1 Tax=Puccinia sorghi TaxID=27349 RepID=A0A0L6VJX5_9BASI|nr:uncharacterized protein VP01_1557g4 [Puccinia sorghi]